MGAVGKTEAVGRGRSNKWQLEKQFKAIVRLDLQSEDNERRDEKRLCWVVLDRQIAWSNT